MYTLLVLVACWTLVNCQDDSSRAYKYDEYNSPSAAADMMSLYMEEGDSPPTTPVPTSQPPTYTPVMVTDYNNNNQKNGVYVCGYKSNGKKYAINGVCFAYFECVNGEATYKECSKGYRFDANGCVYDSTCTTACPKGWAPYAGDITKFLLAGVPTSCPYGTYFDSRLCTCKKLPAAVKSYGNAY